MNLGRKTLFRVDAETKTTLRMLVSTLKLALWDRHESYPKAIVKTAVVGDFVASAGGTALVVAFARQLKLHPSEF